MISRWEDVARRTAAQLNLPEEVVLEHIRFYARKTVEIASRPTVMEMDLLGLGCLQASYVRLKNAVADRQRRLLLQRRYVQNYVARGNTSAADKCTANAALLEEELAMFTALLDTKQEFKNGKKRKNFLQEFIAEKGGYRQRKSEKNKQETIKRGGKPRQNRSNSRSNGSNDLPDFKSD